MALFLTFCFLVLFGFFSHTQTLRYQKEEMALSLAQKRGLGPSPCMDSEGKVTTYSCPRKTSLQKRSSEKNTKKKTAVRHRAGINLYHLLSQVEFPLLDQLFLKLFDDLYTETEFYSSDLGERFLTQLKKKAAAKSTEKKGKTYLNNLEDLATVDLEDPYLQKVLYQVLKGCESPYDKRGFPSLYEFLVLEHYPHSKMNLYEVDHRLLVALFDSQTADYIVENRETWKEEEALIQIERFSKQGLGPYREWIGYKVRKAKNK